MDSFFASCEEACNPALRQVPLIICGRFERGVVTAANLMAKTNFGVKTGMSGGEARRLCPHGVFVVGDLDKYIHFSRRINELMRAFSPRIEPYSIDELFLEITGCPGAEDPKVLALRMKRAISEELDLPSSVGIGPSRFLAKMGCKLGKPDGLMELDEKSFRRHYWPKAPSTLWGIGPRGEKALLKLGIGCVGDLARYPLKVLESNFGVRGRWYHDMAWGRDESRVGILNERPQASYGHSHVLRKDSADPRALRALLYRLCDGCASRMRADGVKGRTVHLGFAREHGFWAGHQETLREAVDSDTAIFGAAWKIFRVLGGEEGAVRAVAVSVSNLEGRALEREMDLFAPLQKERTLQPEREEQLLKALDKVRAMYGDSALMRGAQLDDFKSLKAVHFQTARRFQSS